MNANSPDVVCLPEVFLSVYANGRKEIYDVESATKLRDALDKGLKSLAGQVAAPETKDDTPDGGKAPLKQVSTPPKDATPDAGTTTRSRRRAAPAQNSAGS